MFRAGFHFRFAFAIYLIEHIVSLLFMKNNCVIVARIFLIEIKVLLKEVKTAAKYATIL
jgi:hypothetical protein